MMYVVTVCVGLVCTNFVDTKYETRTLAGCLYKGRLLAKSTGHGWYVRTGCRPKNVPGSNKHGWSNN